MSRYSAPYVHPIRNWWADLIIVALIALFIIVAPAVWGLVASVVTGQPASTTISEVFEQVLTGIHTSIVTGTAQFTLILIFLFVVWRIGANVDTHLERLSEQLDELLEVKDSDL